MRKDLKSNIGAVLMKEPVNMAGATGNSDLLDTSDCEGVEIDVIIGVLTGVGAANYLTPSLEECDITEGDDFTTVDADDMIGAFTKVDAADEDGLIQRVGYTGTKRYVRVALTYTGTITAGVVGVIGILGYSKEAPFTVPVAVSAT